MTVVARPLVLRDIAPADVGRIIEITQATGVFRADEISIAGEVIAEAVSGGPTPRPVALTESSGTRAADLSDVPYHVLGAELEGHLVGWICWGATSCTVGTWDLYWLAVDPIAQGHGVGTALVGEMERRLAGVARLISIDTSGRREYAPTRRFYQARGYRAVAVVPDFYAPGDDQVIFTKVLARQ